MKKEILIGSLVAIFATVCGFFMYVQFFSKFGFYETLDIIKEGNLIGKVLGLAAIPNLFVFFVFIKKKQDYRARGVLLTTVVIALIMLIMKFI
ncbi:hypothetical protein [Urechidicola croceus]|nr:hypothetical protein [Urechidicola croceus]